MDNLWTGCEFHRSSPPACLRASPVHQRPPRRLRRLPATDRSRLLLLPSASLGPRLLLALDLGDRADDVLNAHAARESDMAHVDRAMLGDRIAALGIAGDRRVDHVVRDGDAPRPTLAERVVAGEVLVADPDEYLR